MMLRAATVSLALFASVALAKAESPSPIDGQFAVKASIGNTFEIRSSQMALKMSTDPAVRSFARRMIADHTKAQAELNRAAEASGADAGRILDDVHEQKLSALESLSGPEFDQAYWADQSDAHHETLQILDDFAVAGSDPALLSWSMKTRPVVVMHLVKVGTMSNQ